MFTKEDFFKKLFDIDIQIKEKRNGLPPESVLYLSQQQYKEFQKRGWFDKNGNIIFNINGKDRK